MKQVELTRSQERILDQLAQSSDFWGSVRAKYADFGSLTHRQFEIFERDAARLEWQRDAQRIGGLPVRNRFRVGNQPRCAHREQPYCESVATVVVGRYGYCADHADVAREEFDSWRRSRDEARARASADDTPRVESV